ncbi:hypothetical protein PC128_g1090 [Phytophthora cactorum]|nr:hypothetical protein PC128_g1090 [Phytophthora cactorum]
MRLLHVLLVMAIALIANTDALSAQFAQTKSSTVASSDVLFSGHLTIEEDDGASEGRLLRVNKMVDDDTDKSSKEDVLVSDTEESGGVPPTLMNAVAKVSTPISSKVSSTNNWIKVTNWLTQRKSLDYARKALGVDDLSGAALRAHPNYKQYNFFVKLEETIRKGLDGCQIIYERRVGEA